MTNKQKITDTSCPSCWENKNNIDEVLEEFDEIYPRIMKINHSIERRESIKNFLKQKLQQVEEHETENGYCCACEYDIACMNEKIDIAVQRKVDEIRKQLLEKHI